MSTEKTWSSTPVQHLYRHKTGTYYARLTIGGRPTFRSLKTQLLSVAKPALSELLQDNAHRNELSEGVVITEKMTGKDALNLRESQFANDASTKKSTKHYWTQITDMLRKSWPEFEGLEMRRITVEQCENWAGKTAKTMSPSRFNGLLLVLRSLFKIAIKRGVRRSNPALEVRRAKIRLKDLSSKLPGKQRFTEWVAALRRDRGKKAKDCADLVEFLAYTGMRIGETKWVEWQHCDFAKGEILIVGAPVDGTKNGSFRRVPMIPAARKLLERLQKEHNPASPKESVLKVHKAYTEMTRTSKKIGMEPISHHDLRHLFATMCIESGVDVPTVSRWLGHRDGGILAMKVYGHLRNEHSLAAASRVSFGV